EWFHDRSNTVGASEIGQCIRKTWFSKHDIQRDEGYIDRYGVRLRGTLIENHYWVPAMQAAGALYTGQFQKTVMDGYLSATPDGIMPDLKRECLTHLGVPDIGPSRCIALETKSIDPRVNLTEAKSEHVFQTHVQ